MVSIGKGSRVGPGKKRRGAFSISGLSHTFQEGEQEKGFPQHMQRRTYLTDEQQRNRTVWMMFTREQEKNSEQEGQPVKAGECRAKLWC